MRYDYFNVYFYLTDFLAYYNCVCSQAYPDIWGWHSNHELN